MLICKHVELVLMHVPCRVERAGDGSSVNLNCSSLAAVSWHVALTVDNAWECTSPSLIIMAPNAAAAWHAADRVGLPNLMPTIFVWRAPLNRPAVRMLL